MLEPASDTDSDYIGEEDVFYRKNNGTEVLHTIPGTNGQIGIYFMKVLSPMGVLSVGIIPGELKDKLQHKNRTDRFKYLKHVEFTLRLPSYPKTVYIIEEHSWYDHTIGPCTWLEEIRHGPYDEMRDTMECLGITESYLQPRAGKIVGRFSFGLL